MITDPGHLSFSDLLRIVDDAESLKLRVVGFTKDSWVAPEADQANDRTVVVIDPRSLEEVRLCSMAEYLEFRKHFLPEHFRTKATVNTSNDVVSIVSKFLGVDVTRFADSAIGTSSRMRTNQTAHLVACLIWLGTGRILAAKDLSNRLKLFIQKVPRLGATEVSQSTLARWIRDWKEGC